MGLSALYLALGEGWACRSGGQPAHHCFLAWRAAPRNIADGGKDVPDAEPQPPGRTRPGAVPAPRGVRPCWRRHAGLGADLGGRELPRP